MNRKEFYKGFVDGLKLEAKRLGLFDVLRHLVRESDENDKESIIARINRKRKEALIQKKMEELKAKSFGAFSDEELRNQAIAAVNREKKGGSLPKTNYFRYNDDDDDVEDDATRETSTTQPKKPFITKELNKKISEDIKSLNNKILEDEVKDIYLKINESSNPLEDMKKTLEDIIKEYAEPTSLFSSFLDGVERFQAEKRVVEFLNIMQNILLVLLGQEKRMSIARTINEFREKFVQKMYDYVNVMRQNEIYRRMNSVFRTHSDFNPAHQQRGSGGSLFSWMGRVGKVAEIIKGEVESGAEISHSTINALLDVIEQAAQLIIKYQGFRDKERESEAGNRWRLKTTYKDGKAVLATNSLGQVVIGSGAFPFYPSFIEFYLRGTIKRASGKIPTIIDRILLISEATVPLEPEEKRSEDEVFTRMRKIASVFYQNRIQFTKTTNRSKNFARREVPAFYDRIVQAFEDGYSSHGEMLEFATMFANWLSKGHAQNADVCTGDYDIDRIRPYIGLWTRNYKFFIDNTKASKIKGQVQAMSGQMTKSTKDIKAISDMTSGSRQRSYSNAKNIRKKNT